MLGVIGMLPLFDHWKAVAWLNAFIVALLALGPIEGCSSQDGVDRCQQKQMLRECLASAPEQSEYEGWQWSEVVKECERAAYSVSVRRNAKYIRKECR